MDLAHTGFQPAFIPRACNSSQKAKGLQGEGITDYDIPLEQLAVQWETEKWNWETTRSWMILHSGTCQH